MLLLAANTTPADSVSTEESRVMAHASFASKMVKTTQNLLPHFWRVLKNHTRHLKRKSQDVATLLSIDTTDK